MTRQGGASATAPAGSPNAITVPPPGPCASKRFTERRSECERTRSMADPPAVSVLIPTHQRREALRRVLLSLAGQSAPAESYEVVVSIDGSSDGSAEMVASLEVPY